MRHSYFISIVALFILFFGHVNNVHATDFGPFQGRIVDADTKVPIEGVVVLVEWREVLMRGGSRYIDAQETVTDKDGNFYLPGIWVFSPFKRLGSDTMMTIFKSGYKVIGGGAFRDWGEANIKWEGVLKIEDRKPVFGLKKLTMEERRKAITFPPLPPGNAAKEKVILYLMELNKEANARGIEIIDSWGGEKIYEDKNIR